MTGFALIVAVGLPTAAAYAVLARAWRDQAMDVAFRLLLAGLAVPLGLGSASLFTYAWLVAGGTLGTAFALADAALFGAITAAALWRAESRPRGPSRTAHTMLERVAIAAALVAVAAVAASFVQMTVTQPHGGWDAWAIWNQRARFLLRAGEHWRTAFQPEVGYSHPGYPLLLPSVVARLWAYSGETLVAPALVAGAFTFAPALVVFAVLSRRVGWLAAATASLLLLAAKSWVHWGASQYADVPVACFVVGAVAAVVSVQRVDGNDPRGAYVLGGVLLGLSTWTKDEGLILAAVFGAWAIFSPRTGSCRVRASALAAGALVPLVVRTSFQLTLAPRFAAVFTEAQSVGGSVARLLDPARWGVILAEVPGHVPGAETWLPLVAVVAALLLGATWRGLRTSPIVPAVAAGVAFLLVYGVTPLDLRWHLGTSASRVLLQPWPSFVLGAFLLAAPAGAERGAALSSRPQAEGDRALAAARSPRE